MLLQHVTGWPRTGFLAAAYPDLKVVNVVRDGRAVVNSWLQMGWWDGWRGPDNWYLGPLPADLRGRVGRIRPVVPGARRAGLEDADGRLRRRPRRPPGRALARPAVRGRGRDPRKELTRALEFLGLDWSPEFERGFGKHELHPGRGDAYLAELSPAQLSDVEHTLRVALTEWGY